MGLQLITPPSALPISLAEAKAHCRAVDGDDENDLFHVLIAAAGLAAERISGRALVAATWLVTLREFPICFSQKIRPDISPLVAVNSITYTDANGDEQTIDADVYLVSTRSEPGVIEPIYGTFWPYARCQEDSVQIELVAGYPVASITGSIAAGEQTVTPDSMAGIIVGSILNIRSVSAVERVKVTAVGATTFTATFRLAHTSPKINCVPETIQAGIKLCVGEWFKNREPGEVPMAAEALFAGEWTGNYLGYH